MKVAIIALRTESKISGEYRSSISLKQILENAGCSVSYVTERLPEKASKALVFSNLFDFRLLKRIYKVSRSNEFDVVVLKVPTIAQLPLISLLLFKSTVKFIFLFDSFSPYKTSNKSSLLKELKFEPLLALAKRVVHFRLWSKLSFCKPFAVVSASSRLLEQVEGGIGNGVFYEKIPNVSPASPFIDIVKCQSQADFKKNALKVGYLGHAYAYKGCIDLIESSKKINSSRYRYIAAFSHSGSSKVRNYWRNLGGETVGVVDPDKYLSELDVLCLPLYADYGTMVYPNVLLEAMRVGVPILTTRLPSLVELLGEHPPFPYLTSSNPVAIAEGIKAIEQCDANKIKSYLRNRYKLISQEKASELWSILISKI